MKPIPKKLFIFIFVFLLITGLFLFNVREVKAGLIEKVVSSVFWVLMKIAQAFLGFVANIFSLVLNFGFQDMSTVKIGWTITRDIVNMFFILGLIVIAFANILRIESYMMKALLMKFIIIALLINFSYLACGLIIDATQITSNYFLSQIKIAGQEEVGYKDVGLIIADRLNVTSTMRAADEGQAVAVTETDPARIVLMTQAFSTAVMFLAGFVLLIGAILLFLRIGALWTLIILVPFAWFFSIFPKLKTHADTWWQNFLKWAFFAPVYVFFIYLIIKISEADIGAAVSNFIEAKRINPYPAGLNQLTTSPMFQSLSTLFQFAFLLVLLYGAPTVAMSMGIKAAGTVTAFAKGALKGAAKVAVKAPLKAGWRKFERDVLAPRGLSPKVIKEAWKLRREEKEERVYRPAIGKWMDRFNRVINREKTFNENREIDLLVDKERGDLRKQGLSKEELSNILFEAKKSGRTDRAKAAMLELVSRADEEGPFEHAELGAKYGNITSAENWQQLIQDTIKDKKEAIRFTGKVGALGKLSAIPYLDGLTKYDAAKNENVWTTGTEIGKRGGYEAMKIQPRIRWQLLNRRNFHSADKDGNPVAITNAMKVMLRQLSTSDISHAVQYMSSVNKHYLVDGERMIRDEIDEIAKTDLNQAAIAENWFVEIKKTI